MKPLSFIMTLLLAGLVFPAAAETPLSRAALAGGEEVWLWHNQDPAIIALTLLFDGGQKLDPKGKEGLSNMVAGLLDEGAGNLDAVQFQASLAEHAIRLEFDVGRDQFTISMQFLAEKQKEAFALLRLALTRPHFSSEAQKRIEGELLTALASEAQNPNAIAWQGWKKLALDDHLYARNGLGTAETLAAIEQRDIKAQYRTLLSGARFFAASGAFKVESLRSELDHLLAVLPPKKARPVLPDLRFPLEGRQKTQTRPQDQMLVYFGLPGLKREHPDFIPAHVMTHILGGGAASRLTQAVRGEAGFVYHISASLVPWQLGGVLVGQAATRPDKAEAMIARILAEMALLAEDGVGEAELAEAKAFLTGSYVLRFDSSAQIASQLASLNHYGLGLDYIAKRNALIEAVRAEDIQRTARALLQPERLLLFRLGPQEGMGEKKYGGKRSESGLSP